MSEASRKATSACLHRHSYTAHGNDDLFLMCHMDLCRMCPRQLFVVSPPLAVRRDDFKWLLWTFTIPAGANLCPEARKLFCFYFELYALWKFAQTQPLSIQLVANLINHCLSHFYRVLLFPSYHFNSRLICRFYDGPRLIIARWKFNFRSLLACAMDAD